MRIILFTHPAFLASQSMPRFARFLAEGMQQRGHSVELWTPQAFFYRLPIPNGLKKWMGYLDQYLLFPQQVKRRLKSIPVHTLFVFADQALGPWVPLVANRPHIIHCHDFLAQRSALNLIPENPTSSTGKKYQAYIRKGYQKGQNFISVSNKTRQDLHQLLQHIPVCSKMVYNGLTQNFGIQDSTTARQYVQQETSLPVQAGYILHVGGNQWYKNRPGVIQIYNSWRSECNGNLPLLMIGAAPASQLKATYEQSPYKDDIHWLSGKSDEFIKQAYSGASVFLFPSLDEGFGWPIAEAMASGCPVITTNEAPMTEVGGSAAFYIPRKPHTQAAEPWALQSARILQQVISLTPAERTQVISNGLNNASRFNSTKALNQIEKIYQEVLAGC